MSTPQIRHRRLEAFYKSKVLNSLTIVIVTSLFLMAYTRSMLLPAVCASTAFSLFIGYSLWLWIKKPDKIVINKWLSNISGWLTLYFLITINIRDAAPAWYILPIVAAIITMFIALTNNHDEVFNIDLSSNHIHPAANTVRQ